MEIAEECIILNVLRNYVIIFAKSFGLVKLSKENWEQLSGRESRVGAVHFSQLTISEACVKVYNVGKQICRYDVSNDCFEFYIRPRYSVAADPFSFDDEHVHFGKVLVPQAMPDIAKVFIRANFNDHIVPGYYWIAVQFYDEEKKRFVNLTSGHSGLIGEDRPMPTEDLDIDKGRPWLKLHAKDSYHNRARSSSNGHNYERTSRDVDFHCGSVTCETSQKNSGTYQSKELYQTRNTPDYYTRNERYSAHCNADYYAKKDSNSLLHNNGKNRRDHRAGKSRVAAGRSNRKKPSDDGLYFEYNGSSHEEQMDEQSDEDVRREFAETFAITDECALKFLFLGDDDVIRNESVGLVEKNVLIISIENGYSIGLVVPEGNSYARINYFNIDKTKLQLGYVYRGNGGGIKNNPFTVSVNSIQEVNKPESIWEYATMKRNHRFIFEVTFNDMAFEALVSKGKEGSIFKTKIGNVLLDNDCIEACKQLGENQSFKVQAQHVQITDANAVNYVWYARYDTISAI